MEALSRRGLPGFVGPGPVKGLNRLVTCTPTIGDVNGDGEVDLQFAALDHRRYAVNCALGVSL